MTLSGRSLPSKSHGLAPVAQNSLAFGDGLPTEHVNMFRMGHKTSVEDGLRTEYVNMLDIGDKTSGKLCHWQ